MGEGESAPCALVFCPCGEQSISIIAVELEYITRNSLRKEPERRRRTVTSSLNEISTEQLAGFLDRYLKAI
jgi:hypothetical protein